MSSTFLRAGGFRALQRNVDFRTSLTEQEWRSKPVADGAMLVPTDNKAFLQGEFQPVVSGAFTRAYAGAGFINLCDVEGATAVYAAVRPCHMIYSVRGDSDSQTIQKLAHPYRQNYKLELNFVYDPSPVDFTVAQDDDSKLYTVTWAGEDTLAWAAGQRVFARYFAASPSVLQAKGDGTGARVLLSALDPNLLVRPDLIEKVSLGTVLEVDTTASKITVEIDHA